MDRSLLTAATGMEAQQTNIDLISNNLANLNTSGYKKNSAHFTSLFVEVVKAPGGQLSNGMTTPNGVQIGLGTRLDATNKSFASGSLTSTENSLDLAIEGDGFFQVQLPNGQFGYTRDGNWQIDGQSGQVVSNRGYPIFPPINLGEDVERIMIDEEGLISVIRPSSPSQADQVGNIQLVRFVNPAGLIEHTDNLFLQSPASGQPIQGNPSSDNFGTLRQGFLEGSNVKVVEEIVNMITAQRAYEANSNMIKASDEMLKQANSIAV